jgi:phospholipid/cholesterol/gamma-HCH transport system substrate-binding protein
METSSPAVGKLLTMVLFTLSCAGLLLFLWLSFGGSIPLNPQGYRVEISLPNANELSTQADVRIAGVNVGKVVKKQVDPQGNGTIATIQLDNQYAPIHKDAHAILREKTILGEVYVDLSPGTPRSPTVPDGGMLARGQVQPAVQISQIFDAFDPPTRRAFQVWQQELATAVQGNQQNLSNVLGNLPTFAADASDVLAVLDVQHASVVSLVRNGGTVFDALGHNQTALRSLITSGESVFSETAKNQDKLAETFRVFPTFLRESRITMARLKTFALNTDPVIRQLDLVARDLKPTLQALDQLAPPLRNLFVKLGPLITASQSGLPAYSRVLLGARPTLSALGTFLEQLNPIVKWISLHQQLTSDFISNGAYGIAGKTTTFGGAGLTCNGAPCGHYLRQFGPTGAETFGIYPNRDANNRGNTYPAPLWLANPQNLKRGDFPAWDCKNAGGEHGPIGTDPTSGGQQACWVQPKLPGAKSQYQIPHILKARYPSK